MDNRWLSASLLTLTTISALLISYDGVVAEEFAFDYPRDPDYVIIEYAQKGGMGARQWTDDGRLIIDQPLIDGPYQIGAIGSHGKLLQVQHYSHISLSASVRLV